MTRWACFICDGPRAQQLCQDCRRSWLRYRKQDETLEGAVLWGAQRARFVDGRKPRGRLRKVVPS